jgi:hypothetical protein
MKSITLNLRENRAEPAVRLLSIILESLAVRHGLVTFWHIMPNIVRQLAEKNVRPGELYERGRAPTAAGQHYAAIACADSSVAMSITKRYFTSLRSMRS